LTSKDKSGEKMDKDNPAMEELQENCIHIKERLHLYKKILSGLYQFTSWYVDFPLGQVNYTLIADQMRELSGAAYVVINTYDRSTARAVTRGLSGQEQPANLEHMLGFNLLGATWQVGDKSREQYSTGRLFKVKGLYELAFKQLPFPLCWRLERLLKPDSIYAMGLTHQGLILGSVVLIMPPGRVLDGHEVVELFGRIIAAAILRSQVENELVDSRERYRFLIEHCYDAFFVFSPDTRLIDVNPAACRLLGYTREDLLQLKLEDLIPVLSPAGGREAVDKFLKEGSFFGEVEVMDKWGRVFPAEVNANLLPDGNFFGTARDISARKKLEAELVKASKLESVNIVAGGIAHDFNNILSILLGNVSLARMYVDKQEKLKAKLNEIEQAVQQAKALTRQLVAFTREDNFVKTVVPLDTLVRDTVTFALSGSGIYSIFSFPEDLWPVEVDTGQIKQVLNNIVINAVQAMPDGGTIEVTAQNFNMIKGIFPLPLKQGNYIKLSLTDQGEGIPEQNLHKIFDPYFTTKKEGTGLGLVAAYSIVFKHNGCIEVESEVGVGSTFHIYLPASPGKQQEKEEENKKICRGTGKVLVMDDDEGIRKVAGEILCLLGYSVTYANNGGDAIALYKQALKRQEPFDVVILDLTVTGGMGGRKAIQALKQIDPGVKAIVSSGHTDDPALSNCGEYGFIDYIIKPYNIQELARVVKKALKH